MSTGAENAWVIGYAAAANSASEGTWRDTRIGGRPLWPPGGHPVVPKCPNCDRERVLVSQAFAPHSRHSDRIILLFGCNSVLCSRKPETWLSFRAFLPSALVSPKAETANTMTAIVTKATDWDSDSNSSGSEDDDDYLDDLLALQNLQISTKSIPAAAPANPKPSKETDSQVIAAKGTVGSGVFLSPHFVEVDIEPKDSKSTDDASRVQKLLEQYAEEEKNEKLAGEGAQWDAEKETETEASEAVDAFRETVARAPEQVLRYNFGSAPLWPSFPAPPAQHASCPHCGANQVFELQLLGSALSYLKPECIVPTSQEVAGMNFMALAVYTCEKDCEKELGPGAAATSVGTFQFRTQEVRIQNDEW